MRKSLIGLAVATAVASVNVQAQDNTGGAAAGGAAAGGVTTGMIAAGVVGGLIVGGIVSNSNGDAPERPVTPTPTPTCEGDDDLVDGVCIGTTITVTTTGPVTSQSTITVPVTFTYSPSI
ncbi:MAG: hypothetical protein ABJV04_20655 [Aliiglaciecola sp.]|uniref:hypothetical protein n=1 Tax=Aliiglaciecola sp. TaxID=1872441 RepID=UPI003297C2AC